MEKPDGACPSHSSKSQASIKEAERCAAIKIEPEAASSLLNRLHRSAAEIRFRVDDVEPCPEPCILTKTRTRLKQDIGRPVLACSHDESSEVILAAGAATHGLVNAVYVAFSQHRPLVLTPDVLWITLAQGFAHHITNHAEALRSSVVRHKGKISLEATTEELLIPEHWAVVVQQWSEGICINLCCVISARPPP